MKTHPLSLALLLPALAGCDLSRAQARESTAAPLAYGVFERLAGTASIDLKPGTNIRSFNHNTQIGAGITLSDDGKTVFLDRGTYRISGLSITTYEWGHDDANGRPRPGYAFLWTAADTSIVLIGSVQDPQFSAPSEIDGIVQVASRTGYQFGHQNGGSVGGVKFETGHTTEHGGGHLVARLVVQRLPE